MMSPPITQSFWNMTYLTLNWRHLSHLARKQSNWGEGPRCTWCHGSLFHIHPWLLFWIGVGKNVLQTHHKIESIKCGLWIDTTFPLWQWDKLHLRVWSWPRSEQPQGYVEFNMECDLVWYESKIETIMGMHSWSFLGESTLKSIQTPSQKYHLQINLTCVENWNASLEQLDKSSRSWSSS